MSREVITVGGGTGSPIINETLLRTDKVDYIHAVAAMYDSSGATGRRRLTARGNEVAYSDALRILRSLIAPDSQDPKDATFIKWISNRNDKDEVLGQEMVDRFFNRVSGFADFEEDIRKLGVVLHGRVLPSSSKPSHIVFHDDNGRKFVGEHNLDYQRMSSSKVVEMHLEPEVEVFPETAQAIEEASTIVLSCGSMYGSVLANFLPSGMKEALARSRARMYMVTNLISTRNENHDFSPLDFVTTAERHTGRRPDGLVVPTLTRRQFESQFPRVADVYAKDHAFFLGWEDHDLKEATDEGVEIISHDAINIVAGSDGFTVVRHSPEKLAGAMVQIFPSTSV